MKRKFIFHYNPWIWICKIFCILAWATCYTPSIINQQLSVYNELNFPINFITFIYMYKRCNYKAPVSSKYISESWNFLQVDSRALLLHVIWVWMQGKVTFFNPHGYRKCGPDWPAYASFTEISIKFDLEMNQASWKQFQNEKSVNFQRQNGSRVIP